MQDFERFAELDDLTEENDVPFPDNAEFDLYASVPLSNDEYARILEQIVLILECDDTLLVN